MNTKIKLTAVLVCSLAVTSCGDNSDGSDASTYSSCSIIESQALLASDRATDVSQCWDGVNYTEKSLATSWCAEKINTYMGRYIFGHTVKYQVSSTNCPN